MEATESAGAAEAEAVKAEAKEVTGALAAETAKAAQSAEAEEAEVKGEVEAEGSVEEAGEA